MRKIKELQLQLGEVAIEEVRFNPKSRDDIPAILRGLQYIYANPRTREQLFSLLEKRFLPEVNLNVGRRGMDIWRVLVLGVLKQGLGCDFDRLHSLANSYSELRQMLGHSDYGGKYVYELQTMVDNVSLLTPELLREIGAIVVRSGHELAKKKPGEGLRGRADSFPVNTDVDYPTDVKLLWDATRSLIREVAEGAGVNKLPGWRQRGHLIEKVKKLFNGLRTSRKRKGGEDEVKEYLRVCGDVVRRAERTLLELVALEAAPWRLERIRKYIGHARRQMDQIGRRLLKGEVIPHGEKVFSVFEEHTRWISKGKAGVPVEFGVPVCVMEDQHQFNVNHSIMWDEDDVDVIVPFVEDTKRRYPDLRVCSFDRGFHSPRNRGELDRILELNVLPKKGKLNSKDKEREGAVEFVEAKRRHPAVESAINALNHKGCERVRAHGADMVSPGAWLCPCLPPTCTGWGCF